MYSFGATRRHKAPCGAVVQQCGAVVAPVASLAREFCLETSMHGFRHVAVPRRHWLERVLWLAATALASWGAVHVSLGQLQRYNESPTVVTLEKDFRSWEFSLPAVTACHRNRSDRSKVEETIDAFWSVAPSDDKYAYYSRFVRAVSDSNLRNLSLYEEFEGDDDLVVDLFQLAIDVTPELDIKTTVENSNVLLKWIPVMTELGACYSINSLAVNDVALLKLQPNDTAIYPLTCKYGSSSSCHIMMEITSSDYNFFYHSPFDIVDVTKTQISVFPGIVYNVDLSVLETSCGRGVKDLSAARRACLFNDEPLPGKKVYSTNACRQSCRSRLALQLCKCVPFYYFYDDGPACSPAGMACLAKHAQNLSNFGGNKCLCSTQCLYSVFGEIKHSFQYWDKGPWSMQGSVKYIVQPPKIRYTREIVFHFQDLVVSFGGAAGLFLGASFISFVEVVYFLLERVLRAVSAEDTPTPHSGKKRKPTFEEERMKELTAILENYKKTIQAGK